MFSNGFELVVEANGRRIPEYGKNGKTLIEGRRGYRYEIKFRNSRAERVLVIPSVDGVNVIDGQPHRDSSPGYVVQPYSSLTISGWRTSLSEVRQFEFSDRGGSYAGKTHGAQNCGVIGVQVFGEKVLHVQQSDIHIHHHHWPPVTQFPGVTTRIMDYSSSPIGGPQYTCCLGPTGATGAVGNPGPAGVNLMSSTQNAAPDFNLGTAWGQAMQDQVSQTTFDKGLWLATMEIYYTDADGLAKDGIQVSKAPELASFPQAFGGFCKPPAY